MKIAVVYNRDSKNVINLFGIPNRERYGKKSIARIVDALKKYGRHDDHCGDDGYGCYGGECDCGFDDVLERIE